MALNSLKFTAIFGEGEDEKLQQAGIDLLEKCAANHAHNIYMGKPNVFGLTNAISRIQDALKEVGYPSYDPKGTFGSSTSDAVFKFKSEGGGGGNPILGPGQKVPDRIIGIQTIHRLDILVGPSTPPKKIDYGSTDWGYSFWGSTGVGVTGKETFWIELNNAGNNQVGRDDQFFDIDVAHKSLGMTNGFVGQAMGRFTTVRPVEMKEFDGASCQITLFKKGVSLNGNLFITNGVGAGLSLTIPVSIIDQSMLGSYTDGTVVLAGTLSKRTSKYGFAPAQSARLSDLRAF
jgi:hypothetical protein